MSTTEIHAELTRLGFPIRDLVLGGNIALTREELTILSKRPRQTGTICAPAEFFLLSKKVKTA